MVTWYQGDLPPSTGIFLQKECYERNLRGGVETSPINWRRRWTHVPARKILQEPPRKGERKKKWLESLIRSRGRAQGQR